MGPAGSPHLCLLSLLCVRPAKALASLRGCAGSPERSLFAYMIMTFVTWTGSFHEWINLLSSARDTVGIRNFEMGGYCFDYGVILTSRLLY